MMNDSRVTFRGLGGDSTSTHLEDHLNELLGSTLDSLLSREQYHLDIKITHDNLHNNHRNQRFECEAVVRIDGEKTPVVVRKSSPNFYQAAQDCASTLRIVLGRRSKVRRTNKRQRVPSSLVAS